MEFINIAANGPHPEVVAELKFVTGLGETVTEIVVSSVQCEVLIVKVTLNVPLVE